jgi:serine/threonine-protein phosphatase Stp1
MFFETVSRTHVGCRRKVNEDAFLALPQLGLWAVADGMGGHHAGDVASRLIVELLAACPACPDLSARMDKARAALEQANTQLIAMAGNDGTRRTIGSTVVALGANDGAFTCLWVGDSRAYRARGGKLVQLTRDHSLVQELIDVGDLDPAEAHAHPNANIITRAIGSASALKIDTVSGDVLAGDVFLLASDGLTRLVRDERLLAGLTSGDLQTAADNLIETCLAGGAPDNVTFVILKAWAG